MSNIWDKFDDMFDSKAMANEITEIEKNGASGSYEKVPYDTYIVKITKLEMGVTKETNKPKMVVWFKILEGTEKNKIIFMNQLLSEKFLIHRANEFLRSLKSNIEVNFESFAQYADMLMNIHEDIEVQKLEYQLKFDRQVSKGREFDTFEILTVYEAE